jgi:hypothetical protein
LPEAIQSFQKGLPIYERLIAAHPTDHEQQMALINTLNALANLYDRLGQQDKAQPMRARVAALQAAKISRQSRNQTGLCHCAPNSAHKT